MKQYFIGINKRSEKLVLGLLNLDANLMFYWHPKTVELNYEYKFYDGEWFLLTSSSDNEIHKIEDFLEREKNNDKTLETKIIKL